ncbi:MAG: hypothetical protein DMG26_16815, partial [Acidobacteria bacterium]
MAVRGPWPPEPDEVQRRFFTFKKYTYHRALVTNFGSAPPPCGVSTATEARKSIRPLSDRG